MNLQHRKQSNPDTMRYKRLRQQLQEAPKTWLISGVAGFIGSNLLETLLNLNQFVVGLDNFATGHQRNLDEVRALVRPDQWTRFHLVEGDIRNLEECRDACEGVDYVLHQAALGSVPQSIADPLATNAANVTAATRIELPPALTHSDMSRHHIRKWRLPGTNDLIGRLMKA